MNTKNIKMFIVITLILTISSVSAKYTNNVSLTNTYSVKEQIINITDNDILIKRTNIFFENNEYNNRNFQLNKETYPLVQCYSVGEGKSTKEQTYVINPTNTKGIDENTFVNTVFTSAETWDEKTTQNIFNDAHNIDKNSKPTIYDVYPKEKNTIIFGSLYPFDALAVTQSWIYKNTGEISHFDIILNSDINWGDASTNSQVYDLQSTITHEFGHTFGLDDLYFDGCSQETMYGLGGKGETFTRTLNDGDIYGLNTIFPSTVSTPPPTPTPAPTLSSIHIILKNITIFINDTIQLDSISTDQYSNIIIVPIVWSSSNTTVGIVDTNGIFTALSNGTTVITAESNNVYSNITINVIRIIDESNYDTNSNGIIDQNEVSEAIQDYFNGLITRKETIEILTNYFNT